MNYEESFLSTCDAEGTAPSWAIEQIFKEHHQELWSMNLELYLQFAHNDWDNGEKILKWLGY